MFRILVCRDCGERYDASGLDAYESFRCAGCGRVIDPRDARLPGLFGPEDEESPSTALGTPSQWGPGPGMRRRIGPYQVLSETARGGMGVVYRCRHVRRDETVALKVLLSPRKEGRNMVQRFRHEGRVASLLEHPHIVPVKEIGHMEGLHYFSMPYIEGLSLDEHFTRKDMTVSKGVSWLMAIADALDYLHERGFVHRDLKPGNILVDASGHPWLIDFGLAKIIDAPQHLTRPGMAMGTPAYMAPEQAEGSRRIDGRADVYALGAVLFEMITGQPPFKGESLMETMLLVVSDTTPSIREHVPDVDPRLEAICLKALQKNRNRRYSTARAMAEDLQRFLDGKPVTARPQSLREKVAVQYDRFKVPGLLFMASVAGGFGALACFLALAGRL